MKRPGYREAIFWIANNDDVAFMDEGNDWLSVTASLIVDLFGVTPERFRADVARELAKARA